MLSEIFDLLTPKVRSPGPGQVTQPQKKLIIRHIYSIKPMKLKLAEVPHVISSYKLYISDFFFNLTWGSGQVGQVYHYSQWGK